MPRVAAEGSASESSIGLSGMMLGTSSLQETVPTSAPGPTLTPVSTPAPELPGAVPLRTPTPISMMATSGEHTLTESTVPRAAEGTSQELEQLEATRK